MIDQIMLDSIEAVRSDIPEIQVTFDTDLNSKGFQESVCGLPIVILRKFLAHPSCSEISSHGDVSVFNSARQQNNSNHRADFSMESLERMYGNQKIVILSQDVDVSGFKLEEKNMWEKMTLQSFILYVKGLHQLLSVTDSICVQKRRSLLDAALECMEAETDHRRSAADTGLDSNPKSSTKSNGIESVSVENEKDVDQEFFRRHYNVAMRNEAEHSETLKLRSESCCSTDQSVSLPCQEFEKDNGKFLQVGVDDGTSFSAGDSATPAIKGDQSSRYRASTRNRSSVERRISLSETVDLREKEKICRSDVSRFRSVGSLRSYFDDDKKGFVDGASKEKDIEEEFGVAHSSPCAINRQNISTDHVPKITSTHIPSSLNRDVERARCQLLSLLTIATSASDVEKDATVERFRRRRKKANPSPVEVEVQVQVPKTCDGDSPSTAGPFTALVSSSEKLLMEGAYVSWSGISATDFKKVNQEAVAADVKANATDRAQVAAGSMKSDCKSAGHYTPDISRSREAVRKSRSIESFGPSDQSSTPLSLSSVLPSSMLEIPLCATQNIKKDSNGHSLSPYRCSEDEVDEKSLLSACDIPSYWFQDPEPCIRHVAHEIKGVESGEEIKGVESGEEIKGVESGEEIRGVESGEEIKGVESGDDLADILEHTKAVRMELAAEGEGEGEGVQEVVVSGGSTGYGTVFNECTDYLDSLSVRQSEVDPAQLCEKNKRDERNRQYAVKCRQFRASHLTPKGAPSSSSIAIGWEKNSRKRKARHSATTTPVSARKRKCTYYNLGRENASCVEYLESTLVLREKLSGHKQIIKNLTSNAVMSSASRAILWGVSCVIARLSVVDGVWSLDLTFLPFGITPVPIVTESSGSTDSMGQSTPDRPHSASAEAGRGDSRCILYSPLNALAFQDLGSEASQNCSEGDVDLCLGRILDLWSPLCSGRVAGSCVEECGNLRKRVAGHHGLQGSVANQEMSGALVCDGVAMQAELLRLLKIAPYGVMALLADTVACNLNCNTPCSRGHDCAVGSDDPDPSSETERDKQIDKERDRERDKQIDKERDGERDKNRDPLWDLANSTHQDENCTPHNESPPVALTESAVPAADMSRQTVAASSLGITASTFPKPKKKLKASTPRDSVQQGPCKISDDLQASKLEGVMRGRLKFCTNLDMSEWDQQMQSLRRCIPPWLMCQSPQDLLSLLRYPVEGMSTPQVYIKVPGVWTGGHEENLRFRSVNCTVGPGSSEWFAVDKSHCARLRHLVLRLHGVDILGMEGCWFISPQFLAQHGIPFMHGIQSPDDVIVTRGDTLHWVRGLGFSTHFSWNFGTFDCDQVEACMARYRENDSITKTRNDQFLRRSGGLIQKTEKVNRDKSSKSPGRDKRGVAGDYVKAGGGIGKGAHYRYQPSPVIAFRSLVPMKTLILDLVRELLNAGKGEGRGGGGGGAVEASIYTARDPVVGAISNIADTIKGSWTGSEMFDFTAPPSSHRNMTSAMTDHLQQVLQDRPLLVVLFLELASSVQQLRVDVSVALSVTSLRPFKESYASSNLHCERGSCSMELFEAYVDCPKCGVICLQCASGCGDAHKGGCVEEERVSPETVPFLPQALYRDQCTASPDTVTTASESKMAPSLAETEFRPVTPASAAGHAHAEIAIPHPMRAEVTAVQDSACPDTASSPLATSPPPFPCLDEAKECHPISAPVAHVRVLHVHYPGARLLLKTPLTALSKTVKDFAALIIQLHPEEEERIRTLRVTSPVTSQV